MTNRYEELERRVAAVEQALGLAGPADPAPTEPTLDQGMFWILEGLRARLPEGSAGAVTFAGAVRTDDGPVEWQYGRATDDLLGLDDDSRELVTERLAALGHPVRLRLLLAVLRGHRTAAALAELDGMGTTGQVYHHVRALTAAGWLSAAGRGRLRVPPERVVPLLTVLAAAL
ncbi:DNA-binding transcriptional ArsR family regulator [Friedmanniella endophytica]|uniref:DNA-binding transcriptional ArsR family regulator n=1 Tax=Microlunatus kandeliicorticis TaxID=1759536 RepID=A0A7W3P5M8_9ACTN|nr:helix-turn-helix domain-containing protein [Microlunatus kandeliicorticis]MBA8794161.1 DNA-binding transcriptional ArsR family regulator [Microlunatus kandeliicorticis]